MLLSDVRNEETESLEVMRDRHPSDLRPNIAKARRAFDEKGYESVTEMLLPMVAQHPEFESAQLLLGRTLVQRELWNELPKWIASLPVSSQQESDYWLVLGDLAAHQGDQISAVACYVRACARGPMSVESWSKLAQLADELSVPKLLIVQARSQQLLKLRQNYAELAARSYRSIDNVEQIALLLERLGRLWESEAWLAYALSDRETSSADKIRLSQLRVNLMKQMAADQPWQLPELIAIETTGLDEQADKYLANWLKDSHADVDSLQSKFVSDSSSPSSIGYRGDPPELNLFLNDQAARRGLSFHGRTAADLAKPGVSIHEAMGCGGGAIDYDRDGWPDVYLASAGGEIGKSNSGENALFRNQNGHLLAVTESANAADRGYAQGICCGDPNEDGFDDILILNYGPDRLYINNGEGTFTDQSTEWLFGEDHWSTSAAFADLDGDGISDLFVTHYCAGKLPSTEKCFSKFSDGPRACSPNHFSAEPDSVLKGDGQGKFVNVFDTWGFSAVDPGRGLGVVAGELDGLPGTDVYVANDMSPNHLWVRKGKTDDSSQPLFVESALPQGLATDGMARSQASMGIGVADLNQDRKADFYVTNYEYEYNTLYMSQASGSWQDRTVAESMAKPTLPLLGFGTQFIDLDNNGMPELVVANGHVDSITNDKGETNYSQPPLVFAFGAAGAQVVKPASDYFRSLHVGRALWDMDFNRDGRQDLMVTHQTEPVAMLMNETDSGYGSIGFVLAGVASVRSAVGSVLTVEYRGRETTHFLTSGDGYFCSRERRVHVGLGRLDQPGKEENVNLSIQWPSGKTELWKGLKPNRQWLLVEGQLPFELDKMQVN